MAEPMTPAERLRDLAEHCRQGAIDAGNDEWRQLGMRYADACDDGIAALARVAELERRLARAMGAIANYDLAFSGLGGTSDQMDDAEADGKALLAAYAKDRPAAPAPATGGEG